MGWIMASQPTPPTVFSPPSEIKGFRRASEENTKGQWAMIG